MAKKSEKSTGFEKFKKLIINPNEISKKFGYWSTGSPRVDRLLGGGITKGRMSEFMGPPQSGKSTMALSIARGIIENGGRVLYIDLEKGLEVRPSGQGSWLETNGIDAFDGTFDIIQHGEAAVGAEDVYKIMIAAIKENAYQYIVVDSMAAMVTHAEMEGDIGDSTFGSVARINSQGLKTLFALQGTNYETSITWINQVRDQIQGGMGGFKSTGGRALPHYTHQRIRFDKLNRTKEETDGDFLTPIRVRTEKARGAPASAVEITISAKRGIDVLSEVFEAGLDAGIIKQAGAWFSLLGPDGKEFAKVQGAPAVREILEANDRLYKTLYEHATQKANIVEVTDED
jgi:recombination protein RecA